MNIERRIQYVFGGAVIAAVAIFIITLFLMMSRTNLKEIAMNPGDDAGWSYELISGSEARDVTPVIVDDSTVSFPGETCRAVKAARTLKEEMEEARLCIHLSDAICGVDMLLDDRIIYTSFEGAKRDENGFVLTVGSEMSHNGTVEIYLPEDYLGHELTVITYFPSETADIIPIFPYMCNPDTDFSVISAENVTSISRIIINALLALLTALMYLLDISNGKADKKVLLLSLFFLMLTLTQAFNSLVGKYSLLTEKLNAFDFLSELYMAPLLLFIAFCFTSWRKWILTAATGVWFVADAVRLIIFQINNGPFMGKASARVVLLLYLLALVMMIAEMIKNKRRLQKSDLVYILIPVVLAVGRIMEYSLKFNMDTRMYMKYLIKNTFNGYVYPLMNFLSFVCATSATVVVIIEFVKRTLRTRELVTALEEQNRRAMKSYDRMAASENATYAARHEIRHHMLALSGMLQNGDTLRAREYVSALTKEYDDLPAGRYSKNIMVNVLAGTYLERAKACGIAVKHSLKLPETLPIADTDLCVFVTNMFENALNACEKISESEARYIHVRMYINGSYLFIGCENSSPREEYTKPEKKDRAHGYGLENMKRIAEKYGGILKIVRSDSSFSLKSDFYLKNI